MPVAQLSTFSIVIGKVFGENGGGGKAGQNLAEVFGSVHEAIRLGVAGDNNG